MQSERPQPAQHEDALTGVFQMCERADCWCGFSYTYVIDSLLLRAPNPDLWTQPPDEQERGTYATLFAFAKRTCEERRQRLVADLERLLDTYPSEVGRQALIEDRSDGYLFNYRDFWDGDEQHDSERLASAFLSLTLARARSWNANDFDRLSTIWAGVDRSDDNATLLASQRCAEALRDLETRFERERFALLGI